MTIIGAGLGGIALVANLGLARLSPAPARSRRGAHRTVRERGGLDVEGLCHGLRAARARDAPAGAGGRGRRRDHRRHRQSLPRRRGTRAWLAVLRDGQSILLIQGGTGGSLVVRRELAAAGCRAEVDVSEMDNYPYSLGWPEPTRVKLTIVKRFLQVASLPAARGRGRRWRPLRAGLPAGRRRAQHPHHRAHQHERDAARGEHGGQHRPPRGQRQRAIASTPRVTRRASSRCWKRSTPSGLAVATALRRAGPRHPPVAARTRTDWAATRSRETFHRLTHEPTGPVPVDADAAVAAAQVRHRGRAVRSRCRCRSWGGPPASRRRSSTASSH